MAHLSCTLHQRRVVVVEGAAVHRSTQASELSPKCETKEVIIGGKKYRVTAPYFHAPGMTPASIQ